MFFQTQKTKIKHNKTRTNSFLSSTRKTSIHPEILAPVGNEVKGQGHIYITVELQ